VLLQRRADDKLTWPGYLDISTAGHIDLGESPIAAAMRESREEIGLDLDPNHLKLIFVNRKKPPVYSEIQWVYLYELESDHDFTLHDGEVSSLDWHRLDDIKDSVLETDTLHLVPHTEVYFAQLFQHL
jgi:8-oxo-dGTP pyrophosphatase MutT (NUDIX family)